MQHLLSQLPCRTWVLLPDGSERSVHSQERRKANKIAISLVILSFFRVFAEEEGDYYSDERSIIIDGVLEA